MMLSILIATIPEREEQFKALILKLDWLIGDRDIEICFDNTVRYDEPGGITVGEKRQSLIDGASGKYICFVDDDDDVTDTFIKEVYPLLVQNVDVINAKVRAYIDGVEHIIDQSIHYTSEQLKTTETKRYPSVMSVWNRQTILKSGAKFPALNNGEDFAWTKQINPQTEIKVEGIWQIYNYSSTKNVASKATRRAIVTFSNNDRYNPLAERLKQSAKQYGYDVIHYQTFEELGCESHANYPYAFKPYCIQRAREKGYNSILWVDSPIIFTQDPINVFKYIEEHGVLLFDNIGWTLGSYTSDVCLNHFGIQRYEAHDNKMVMACAMGFNFNSQKGTDAFNQYLSFAHTNAYQGRWNNNDRTESKDERCKGHRHDQSVISCIALKKSLMLLTPHKTFIAYAGNPGHEPHADTVCMISKGF